jgi:hypothetical protein
MVMTLYRRKAGSAAFVVQPRIAPIVGRKYGFRSAAGGTSNTAGLVANTLYAMSFWLPQTATVDLIEANITTAATAGKLLRLGLYGATADGLPGALLFGSGSLAADPGAVPTLVSQAISPTIQLVAGKLYYLAVVSDGAPVLTGSTSGLALYGGTDASEVPGPRLSRAFVYAALPDPWGTPTTFSGTPYNVVVRVASVP